MLCGHNFYSTVHFFHFQIIIMSATMDVDHFSSYFNNCKTLYLEGRTYPVKIMHVKEQNDDYMHTVLATIFQIHQSAPPK